MKQLIIIGGGGGTKDYLLPAAKKAIATADCVIASDRILHTLQIPDGESMGKLSRFLDLLPSRLEKQSIALIVSGDPLLYSLYRTIKNKYPDLKPEIIPGVSSLQILGSAFGLTMEQAAILSLHGRECSAGKIAYAVSSHPITFFFCSEQQGVKEIAHALIAYQLTETELYFGSDLTASAQILKHGKPEQFLEIKNPALCVAAVKNPDPKPVSCPALLPDSAFLRNASPMTREEIRAVILSKLKLTPDAVIWDIGAGTGSISVECARMCPFGHVYAVEYKAAALEILQKNKNYFSLENLHICAGMASEQICALPDPECIFIGGSGGEFPELFRQIMQISKKIRLVISAVTLETQAELWPILHNLPECDIMQISVSHAKSIKNYHILQEQHPIMIYSCMTR